MRELQPQTLGAVIEIALQRHGATGGRGLARKAEELGIPMSHTMLNELRRNTYKHPLGREQRERIAQLSGVPQRVVDELAGAPQLAPFDLPERAANLTGDQRRAVLAVVGAFIAANEALDTAQGDAADAWAAQHADPEKTGLPGQSYDTDVDT